MHPDDLNRDKLYSADVGDDDELELEPPDPAVLAAEERRAAEAVEAHQTTIDINEVYRDFEAHRDSELIQDWLGRLRNFRWQFRVKHLLVATAVVAVLLTLHTLGVRLVTVVVILVMGAVAGVSLLLKLEDNKRQEAADRRRQEMYAERRAQQARRSGKAVEIIDVEPLAPDPPAEIRQQATAVHQFRFQFSLAQLLIAITAAAVLIGVMNVLGGAADAAVLCGLVAIAGLAVPAFGYQPPEMVVFGWWVLLAMYVALNLFSAIWGGLFASQ